jgi:glycosyltransferase involved in cell wall biosynthesis
MRTVYPGVDCDDLGPLDSVRLHAELGLPSNVHLVGVIGRLQAWKGHEDFIRAVPLILKSVPDTRFLVVGGTLFGLETEYPHFLKNLVSELGLGEAILFTGHRSDIPRILATLDVVVVPSRLPEPFGTVQVEAMAAGKPVVSTAAGGNLEVVSDGVTGILVSPGEPADIARAVVRLLREPELRQAFGEASRERVRERFSVKLMAERMTEAFAAAAIPGPC